MTGQLIAAAASVSAASVSVFYAWLIRRAAARSPETVAGGYSTLVSDLRQELQRVQATNDAVRTELDDLHAEMHIYRRRVACMESKLSWLQTRMPADVLERFEQAFPPKE